MEQVPQPALTRLHQETSSNISARLFVAPTNTSHSSEEQRVLRSPGRNTEQQSVAGSETQDTENHLVIQASLPSLSTTMNTHTFVSAFNHLHKNGEDYLPEYHSQTVHSSARHGKRLGSLFIIYVGPALWTLIVTIIARFSRKKQLRLSPPSIEFIYHFPLWVTTLALCATLGISQIGTPTFGLVVRRRINETESFGEFTKAISGDSNELCSLFIAKKIHPNDVTGVGGFTLLHVSIRCDCSMRETSSSDLSPACCRKLPL